MVQSALGEPLQAEIDIPEISAAEASSLRVGVAQPLAFRAAGMEFNPSLSSAEISLQRRPDGRAFLKLSSPRSITEPFLDVILEVNWSAGRIVRDYTLLFDPPSLRASTPAPLTAGVAAVAPVAPAAAPTPKPPTAAASVTPVAPANLAVTPTTPPASVAPAAPAPTPRAAPAPSPAPAPAPMAAPTPAKKPAVATPPAPARQPAAAPAAAAASVTVKPGDTAGRIANAHKPPSASLDQMLVAMLRANPQAFINGNINLVRSGAVIELPDEAQATAIAPNEAKQLLSTQSRDFNDFRRRLAQAVTQQAPANDERQVSGKVQTEVREAKPAATPDKLTLSKGTVQGKPDAVAEAQIAKDRQAQEQAARTAELNRNITDLAKLGVTTPAAATAAPPVPAPAPVAAAETPAAPATDSKPAVAPGSTEPTASPGLAVTGAAPAVAEPPAPPAPAVDPAATPATPVAPPVAAEPVAAADSGEVMSLLADNPLILPAAGGLLALLLGLGAYRLRQRKKPAGVDSSFLESRLQPDSFFGASGGQSVDTAEAAPSGSSMMYSPSQLDAGGDVDPVAEADVYLAYGRDLQAEEILKEALRINPTRVAIHCKLLEIFAKRRDARAFEELAGEVFALTQGTGSHWDHTCEMGRNLDPSNALYQPGGSPDGREANATGDVLPAAMVSTMAFMATDVSPDHGSSSSEALDLDLDFSLDGTDIPSGADTDEVTEPSPVETAPFTENSDSIDNGLNFNLDDFSLPSLDQGAPAAPDASNFDMAADGLSFELDDEPPVEAAAPPEEMAVTPPNSGFHLEFDLPDLPTEQPKSPAPQRATAPTDDGLSFDMGDLSLDLGNDDGPETENDIPAGDPLETKLSLAAEFLAIGDMEGARSLAEEVVEQAKGSLQTKAKAFLADLR